VSSSPNTLTEFFFGTWTTMPLDRLRFPAKCCRCGTKTERAFSFRGESTFSPTSMARQLTGLATTVDVPVPFCEPCQARRRHRKLVGALIGLGGGLSFGGAAMWLFPLAEHFDASTARALQIIIVLAISVLGAYAGWLRLGGMDPVKIRRYSEKEGTLQAWFEQAEYRADVETILHEDDR
jgi:hypothetical protein